MSYRVNRFERGSTLLVAMIMLVVLTLLVVFGIRSGNTNLRIAGNMQVQVEADTATDLAIEAMIEKIKTTEDLSTIKGQTVSVSVGAVTYTVKVEPMNNCLLAVPVLTETLKPLLADGVTENEKDSACYENAKVASIIKRNSAGVLVVEPWQPYCQTQQWDIQAGVTDDKTGERVNHVQGISVRVPKTTLCK